MRGAAPRVDDLNLELNDLVLPINLLSEEVLQPSDDESEAPEEELFPFRIDTCCYRCEVNVRITLFAVEFGLRALEQLIVDGKLTFCCTTCARTLRNGR